MLHKCSKSSLGENPSILRSHLDVTLPRTKVHLWSTHWNGVWCHCYKLEKFYLCINSFWGVNMEYCV